MMKKGRKKQHLQPFLHHSPPSFFLFQRFFLQSFCQSISTFLYFVLFLKKDSSSIHELQRGALIDKTDDLEIFMKGIDYSYYYEQND